MTYDEMRQDMRERIAAWIEQQCTAEDIYDDRGPSLSKETVRVIRRLAKEIRAARGELAVPSSSEDREG